MECALVGALVGLGTFVGKMKTTTKPPTRTQPKSEAKKISQKQKPRAHPTQQNPEAKMSQKQNKSRAWRMQPTREAKINQKQNKPRTQPKPEGPITPLLKSRKAPDELDGTKLQRKFQTLQTSWNLTTEMIDKACDRIVMDQAQVSCADRLQLFLYGKGMLSEEGTLARQRKFKALLQGGTKKTRKALKRLSRIVFQNQKVSNERKNSFKSFTDTHAEWRGGNSWIVFRDIEALKDTYVERVQRSGFLHSFIHAPVVLQHYVVAMNTDVKSEVGVMDMAMFLRRYANSQDLWYHVDENRGGNSFEFLRTILQEPPKDAVALLDCSARDGKGIMANLHKYGPALVSNFRVHADFRDKDTTTHRGSPRGEFKGLHAMLLVGYRHEEDLKILYLLQNSWGDKPFVVVDAEYLRQCYPSLWFVKEPQSGISARFDISFASSAEL